MARKVKTDLSFEIGFCEGILRRNIDDSTTMELLAGFYTKAGRIDDGLALDQKLVAMNPDSATAYYNLACSLALKDRKKEAVDAIRSAIEKGYDDFSWMLKDPDLKSLREFRSFEALLNEFEVPGSETA